MRPCDLKATRCQIEGTTRLAYHVGVRNPALVEGKFPGLPAKISDFRDRCTGTIVGQAAARLFDEECRNAFVRLRRVHGLGPRQYENGIGAVRSEEHRSELQSLMRISYAVFCLKKKNKINS